MLCNVAINGAGTGAVTFAELFAGSGDLRAIGVICQQFDAPEPGGLRLLAGGIAALAALAKSRRRRHAKLEG